MLSSISHNGWPLRKVAASNVIYSQPHYKRAKTSIKQNSKFKANSDVYLLNFNKLITNESYLFFQSTPNKHRRVNKASEVGSGGTRSDEVGDVQQAEGCAGRFREHAQEHQVRIILLTPILTISSKVP